MIYLLIFSAICKAVMDCISQGIWRGQWWNKNYSWRNKWKNGDPEQGEKFFGSSTFLVWLTDGWHFFQMLFLNSLFLGLMLYEPIIGFWIDLLFVSTGFKIVFELSYRLIKKL